MKILVLAGDGIGPEITGSTLEVLKKLDTRLSLNLEFEYYEIGMGSLEQYGTTLREEVYDRIKASDGVILGPVDHYAYPPKAEGGYNPSAELRVNLNLYANVRPCRSRKNLSILRDPMDLVIFRENTEGFYSDRNMYAGTGEFMPDENTALSVRKITAEASRNIATAAFEYAQTSKKKVTAVHKANVVKLSDGLFLREVRKVAEQFPEVELEELIVDAAAAALIKHPSRFDVIVTTNMYGDILSDEASELSGSLGLGGALNVGFETAVAQAQHGSAPDIAGQGVANPTSLILSASMLLKWFGEKTGEQKFVEASKTIDAAIDRVLDSKDKRTRDLGGTTDTRTFTDAVLTEI